MHLVGRDGYYSLNLKQYLALAALAILLGIATAFFPLAGILMLGAIAYGVFILKNISLNGYIVIVAIALTSGMTRGALVPLLIPNEFVLLVAFAVTLPFMLLQRRGVPLSATLVIAIAILMTGTIVIPVIAHKLQGTLGGFAEAFGLLAPLQYVPLFLLFKYITCSEKHIRRFIYLLLALSVVIAAVGLLQALHVGFVIDFLHRWYDSIHLESGIDRVTSLLSAWNALGTFLMISLLLVRSLLLGSAWKIDKRLLALATIIIAGCLLATGSFASMIGLVIGMLIIEAFDERLRLQYLAFIIGGMILFYFLLGPIVAERLAYQARSDTIVPQTLDFRFQVWRDVFIPAVKDHLLWGVQPEIPSTLSWQAAESHYLFLLYRGGIIAVIAHITWVVLMLVWLLPIIRRRKGPTRSLAVAVATTLIVLSIMGLTNEVFTFSGVTDYIWIICGIIASQRSESEAEPVSNTETQ